MLTAVTLLATSLLGAQDGPGRAVLQRGGTVWNVQDTTLTQADPDIAAGGDTTLVVGPGRITLLRFGDLERIVPEGARITAARLVLTQVSGEPAVLESVARVEERWGEGPRRTFAGAVRAATPDAKPVPPRGAATWREARAGLQGWSGRGPGAGPGVEGGKSRSDGQRGEIAIEGLATAVQRMADDPERNFGFALRFAAPAEFLSSEAPRGRPRLEVEWEAGKIAAGPDLVVKSLSVAPDGTAVATVVNQGDVASGPFQASWTLLGREGEAVAGESLAPGASREFRVKAEADGLKPKEAPVSLRVKAPGDARPRNDELTGYVGGVNVTPAGDLALVQQSLRQFNDAYLGGSRFSFAPDGADARVNLEGVGVNVQAATPLEVLRAFRAALPLPSYSLAGAPDRYAGLSGWGDTRFEGAVPGAIPLPYSPVVNPLFEANPLEATGMLNATEVAALNGMKPEMPKATLLRVQDGLGRPLGGAKVELFRADPNGQPDATPLTSLTVPSTGSVVLPGAAPDSLTLVRASLNGETAEGWVEGWQLLDAAARGNRAAAFLELRFNLPGGPVDRSQDLAQGKLVSDSVGSLPARLVAAVDGDEATAFAFPETEDWIEVDLGRDRTIGEVQIVAGDAGFWDRFDVVGFGTGQTAQEAALFAREASWTLSGDGRTRIYRGPIPRVRTLRLVRKAPGKGELAEIRVYPVTLGDQ